MVPDDNGSGVTTKAVFADPDGRRLQALHLFRRTPIVSITLGVGNVEAAAEAYHRVFGLRKLTEEDAEEMRDAHVRPESRGRAAVLAFAPAHASTVLVLEPARQAQAGPESPSSSSSSPVIVTLELPDLDTAYHHVIGAGWGASPFNPHAGDASFMAQDPDGNVFHVVKG